jgi:hypothetical protein
MSNRASGIVPLWKRQPPHARLRLALRQIAREIIAEPPGLWSIEAEARARALCGVLDSHAHRQPSYGAAVLVALFERRFASGLLKELRLDDLARVKAHQVAEGRRK